MGVAFISAAAPEWRMNSEDVLKASDEAMYTAKRSGKGRYRFVRLAA